MIGPSFNRPLNLPHRQGRQPRPSFHLEEWVIIARPPSS